MEIKITQLPSGQVRAETSHLVSFGFDAGHAISSIMRDADKDHAIVSDGRGRFCASWICSMRDEDGIPVVRHNLRKALRG